MKDDKIELVTHKYGNVYWLLFLFLTITGIAQGPERGIGREGFVTIKNSTIYYQQKGVGALTVIFISGLGEDHQSWQTVMDSVARNAQTLSYDRSGLGKSDYHNENKDLKHLSGELNSLLRKTGVSGPLVVVGHSLGCQIARDFACRYPKRIQGLVLVDPGFSEALLKSRLSDSLWRQRELALKKYMPQFNPAQQEELRLLEKNICRAEELQPKGDYPVILLTATKTNPDFPASATELQVKLESHQRWLKAWPGASQRIIPESRHYVQSDSPEVVISAVRAILNL